MLAQSPLAKQLKELEFRVIEEAVGGVALDSAVLIYRGANSTAFATVILWTSVGPSAIAMMGTTFHSPSSGISFEQPSAEPVDEQDADAVRGRETKCPVPMQ